MATPQRNEEIARIVKETIHAWATERVLLTSTSKDSASRSCAHLLTAKDGLPARMELPHVAANGLCNKK